MSRILTPEQVNQIGPTNQAEADLLATLQVAWADVALLTRRLNEMNWRALAAEAEVARLKRIELAARAMIGALDAEGDTAMFDRMAKRLGAYAELSEALDASEEVQR